MPGKILYVIENPEGSTYSKLYGILYFIYFFNKLLTIIIYKFFNDNIKLSKTFLPIISPHKMYIFQVAPMDYQI